MTPLDEVLRDALRSRLLRRIGNAIQHDMKSPVQGLCWCLDLVERGMASLPEGDPARAQIARASGLARKELARLEGNSRIVLSDAGILEDEVTRFDLAELTRELTRHFATEAAMRNIELRVAVPEGPVLVSCRRGVISQALLACLATSLDTLPDGGSMDVTLKVEGNGALLEMIDDMPETALADDYSFASMGLRIARLGVEEGGGQLVSSEPGAARRARRLHLSLAPA